MPQKAFKFSDEINEKWIQRMERRKEAHRIKEFNPNHRLVFLCKCPRCEKEHEALIQWSGRGKPRVYCANCRTSIASICDAAYASIGFGRSRSNHKEDN